MNFVTDSTEAKRVTVEEYKVTLNFKVDEEGNVIDGKSFTEQELRDLLSDMNAPKEEESAEVESVEPEYNY